MWDGFCDFQEIADPLMDLKQGMETLRVNKTFRGILSTLLSIGIFLNGNEVGIECQPNDIHSIRLSRNVAGDPKSDDIDNSGLTAGYAFRATCWLAANTFPKTISV